MRAARRNPERREGHLAALLPQRRFGAAVFCPAWDRERRIRRTKQQISGNHYSSLCIGNMKNLAEAAVSCELFSANNSLLTGKNTGISTKFGLRIQGTPAKLSVTFKRIKPHKGQQGILTVEQGIRWAI